MPGHMGAAGIAIECEGELSVTQHMGSAGAASLIKVGAKAATLACLMLCTHEGGSAALVWQVCKGITDDRHSNG